MLYIYRYVNYVPTLSYVGAIIWAKFNAILHITPLLKSAVFVFAKLCSITTIQAMLFRVAKVRAKAGTKCDLILFRRDAHFRDG